MYFFGRSLLEENKLINFVKELIWLNVPINLVKDAESLNTDSVKECKRRVDEKLLIVDAVKAERH